MEVNQEIFKHILKDVKDETKDKLIMSMFEFLSNEWYGADEFINCCLNNRIPKATVNKELLLFYVNKYEKDNPYTIVVDASVNIPFNKVYFKVKRDGETYVTNRELNYCDLETIAENYAKFKKEQEEQTNKDTEV